MNSALAFEIYRGLWFIEGTESSLKNLLMDARAGKLFDPSERLNSFSFASALTGEDISVDATNNTSRNTKRIAVTTVNGVVTKSGGASSKGMQEISMDMLAADAHPDVIGHLIEIDTPGGSEAGMRYMISTMGALTKPKVTIVKRQGQAASAGYGILSQGDYVMAESADAEVGCHGVMWGVSGVPNGEKDGNGAVHQLVISATSPEKNKAPLEAINNNDTSLMQAEVNQKHIDFKASTVAKRPNVTDEHMNGSMRPAASVVGTMIDAVGTKMEAINKILELSKSNNTFNKNSNKKSTAMTAEEIKAQFPDAHAAIYGAGLKAGTTEGIEAEQERVKSWQVFAAVDPEAVQKGIESGKAIAQSEVNSFLLKASSKNQLEKIKETSAGAVITPEAGASAELTPEAVAHAKEVENIFGDYFKKN